MKLDESKFCVRPVYADEYQDAIALAWKTFLRFEADMYTPEGVKSFQNFITNQNLKKLFDTGQYPMFAAVYRGEIVGMLSLRSSAHISLLFVDEHFHYMGIGRKLVEYACTYIQKELDDFKVTVNAAPYAVGFYHKLGFTDMEKEKEEDGVRFTPMSLIL
ncbi:MAG: GNAT family N-acetyltransferase [Lachnospiraceae bacterium]|nr:GNAT family N-acetyltransferase [Lachnospiraceae bacterium]